MMWQTPLDYLESTGHLTPDQLDTARREARRVGKDVEQVLLELHFITEDLFSRALRETTGHGQAHLKHTIVDGAVLSLVDKATALRCRAMPLWDEEGTVHVAMGDPSNVVHVDTLRRALRGRTLLPLVAPESEIFEAIETHYDQTLDLDRKIQALDAPPQGQEPPTIPLINAFLMEAVKRRASDIHFEPEAQFTRVRYRIDGVLHPIRVIHRQYWAALCGRLKIMAHMNIAENRRPQSGGFDFYVGSRLVDFRASAHPTLWGENMVLRVLDRRAVPMTLESLGFGEQDQGQLKTLMGRPGGLTILTGPTGSGKTTTLYALLNMIKSQEINIMTLEEPVEYRIPLVRQTDIREETREAPQDLSFSEGIRSILRQDPDVILVGEIRDGETAQMALRAAMTGHHVLTTVHTNDAFGVFQRFQDLGIPPAMLAGNINGVVAQRLVRKSCACGTGCLACGHTGFRGRTALCEILVMDEAYEELVLRGATRLDLKRFALGRGFESLASRAKDMVALGVTTAAEMARHLELS